MAIVRRAKRETPFVQMDKTPLQDKSLSWKAKGVLAYLLSLPDDWEVYLSEITNHAKDGKDSTRSAFDELMKAGYVTREKARKVKGKFSGYNYTVSDYPQRFNRNGKPDVGKSATTNNDNTNNEVTKGESNDSPPTDLFEKVEGLKKKIGPKHYQYLNEACQKDEDTYQLLRGMFHDGRFDCLMDWLEYKKESSRGYKAKQSIKKLITDFSQYTPHEVLKAVHSSIGSGYSGIFLKKLSDKQVSAERKKQSNTPAPIVKLYEKARKQTSVV